MPIIGSTNGVHKVFDGENEIIIRCNEITTHHCLHCGTVIKTGYTIKGYLIDFEPDSLLVHSRACYEEKKPKPKCSSEDVEPIDKTAEGLKKKKKGRPKKH